eukprot:scaffold10140_cov62-Phaeocystis_antarctica.AAC.2
MACSNTLPRLRPRVCCLRHLARLSPRRRFNLVRLRLDLACILPGYARHSAALQRNGPPPLSPSPCPSQEGSSESERPHATHRALASATYIRRVSAATLRAAAAPAPRLPAPPDLRPAHSCPRRAPARGGGADTALLRGLTCPRASAAPTTLRRP